MTRRKIRRLRRAGSISGWVTAVPHKALFPREVYREQKPEEAAYRQKIGSAIGTAVKAFFADMSPLWAKVYLQSPET